MGRRKDIQVRPIRVSGEVAYVTLTRGFVAVIDAEDVPLVEGFNWAADVDGNTVYAYRMRRRAGKYDRISMHREIVAAPGGVLVDHRDGDGLNCRKKNLRKASRLENSRNRRIGRDNTSGFKGVSFSRESGKWKARIRSGGKQQHLGYYGSPEDAHVAYCRASAALHGEFGRTA